RRPHRRASGTRGADRGRCVPSGSRLQPRAGGTARGDPRQRPPAPRSRPALDRAGRRTGCDAAMTGVRVGFDVGGTKIAGAAFGPDAAPLAEVRAETPRSFAATVDCLAALARQLADQASAEPARVGHSMPGRMSGGGVILVCVNLKWLVRQPLAGALADRLGVQVAIANDGNCFALSEAVDGAGRDAPVVFGVTLGTGV